MSGTPDFTDQSSPGTGTALKASVLDGLVVAQSYLMNGTTPTVPGSGLVVTVPTQQVVIASGTGTATYYTVASGSVTVTNNTTTFIDTDGTTFYATTGALGASRIRLYQVVASGGGIPGGGITLVASTAPIGQAQVQTGANGIATLDSNGRVAQTPARGIATSVTQDLASDQNSMSGTSWTNFPGMGLVTTPGFGGGAVRVRVGGTVYQGGTGGGPTLFNVGISVDGGTVQNVGGGVANPGYNGVIYGERALGTLSGSHTFQLVYAVASGAWSCRPLTQTPEGMHLTLTEAF